MLVAFRVADMIEELKAAIMAEPSCGERPAIREAVADGCLSPEAADDLCPLWAGAALTSGRTPAPRPGGEIRGGNPVAVEEICRCAGQLDLFTVSEAM
jgi:hypothetical protein